ncbi:hypothetical protein [Nocardiopsis sp. YSL2]|uniref:hypothetical protein n=1 Tax=Nocardiopsis sp. YSL2 TaxID=2939492 RepID=UPI0026F463A7|nr:hypothetical protein [Nocardiopsis sp. YSL2]
MSERPHGFMRAKADRCGCPVCHEALRAYENRRSRLIAYGQWKPFTDAAPAREHIRRLNESGIGWQQVARLAGVSKSSVSGILYPRGRRAPASRVRPTTAAAILALDIDLMQHADQLAPGTVVDATGTQRRLAALIRIGWSQRRLAALLGTQQPTISRWLHATRVSLATHQSVIDLYDRLWDTAPPQATPGQRAAASRARRFATEAGWPPPMAWDDDELDDPAAQPQGARGVAA